MLTIAIILTSTIVLPFAWFAVKINEFSIKNKHEDFIFPQFSQFWVTAISCAFFFFAKRAMEYARPLTIKYVPETEGDDAKPIEEEERQKMAEKIESHLFFGTFYFLSSIIGIYVCMDQVWMPWYLGGHGELEKGFIDIPFVKVEQSVLIYGLVNFGFRVESLISHIFFDPRASDFEEMLLHDIVTFFLCFGFIISNFLPVGTMVLILHDCSDFPFHFCKTAN